MQEPRLRLRSGSSVPLKTGGNGESAGKGEEGRSGGIVAEAERLAERRGRRAEEPGQGRKGTGDWKGTGALPLPFPLYATHRLFRGFLQ